MCIQTPPAELALTNLQTVDRVKSYKVVDKVSTYARDLAEGSCLYNYIAPMSQKGLGKLQTAAAPYVPDVSQYVSRDYVKRVDSLGVKCLESFENVTSSSEDALQRQLKGVTQYVNNLLPVEECDAKVPEERVLCGLQHRIYIHGKKSVDWISTGVNNSMVTPVTATVNGSITEVSNKFTPVKEKLMGAISTVNSAQAGLVSSTKRRVGSIKKFREELTYEKLSEYAVASTSSAVAKVPCALQSTKTYSIAYVPESYREIVEASVERCEAGMTKAWKELSTNEEILKMRNLGYEQLKNAISVKGTNVLSYFSTRLAEMTRSAAAPESTEPVAVCETSAPSPEPEVLPEATVTSLEAEVTEDSDSADEEEEPESEEEKLN